MRPLPQEGELVEGVVLVDTVRLELTVEVVRAVTADGSRELRLAFTDLDDAVRSALRAAVGQPDAQLHGADGSS